MVGLKQGKHGFHIHANGDCKDPGPHYNPKMQKHGFIDERDRDYHIGDFGNIDIENNIPFIKTYSVPGEIAGIFDNSQYKIIGKVFVLHDSEDDLGTGSDAGSQTTGNAGRKMACCVISKGTSVKITSISVWLLVLSASTLSTLKTFLCL